MRDAATRTRPDFWRSSGHHLLRRREDGWLAVTPEFLRAYLARPELRPVEESCDRELALHAALVDDPARPVPASEVAALADPDARENYTVVLRFRDLLLEHGTAEGAYLEIVTSGRADVPALFASQLVHAILREVLSGADDPMRARAAELFFRTQSVNLEGGRVMLADEEIVEMYARNGGLGGLGQLLAESMTPMRRVELDVLDEDNAGAYWQRSDRFDTVIDFRFTEPALDAFARVMEAWVAHFLKLETRIQPMQAIRDERWSWHVGLDAEATRLLNALYRGEELRPQEAERILGLFRMEIRDGRAVADAMRGKPVYLGLAMGEDGKLRMKPQNLLANLPLAERG